MRTLLLVTVLICAGCSTANPPFQVYESPLLQAQYHPADRRNREFDPMSWGDHVESPSDVVVAKNEPARAVAPVAVGSALRPKPAVKTSPSLLSTKAETLSTKAETRVGARPDDSGRKPRDVNWQPEFAMQFVAKTLLVNGYETTASSISELYKECKSAQHVRHTKPKVGDVVFFHNVFDANGDGRNNDWYTHVGIVEAVDEGTASVRGWSGGQVRSFKLNVAHPRESELDGVEINSQIRQPGAKDAPFTEYHSGQLFAGFCDVLGDKPELVAIDGWQPNAR